MKEKNTCRVFLVIQDLTKSHHNNVYTKVISDDAGEEANIAFKHMSSSESEGGEVEYLIQWKGYGPSDNTWEPAKQCDCADLIEEFERSREATSEDMPQKSRKRKNLEEEGTVSPKQNNITEDIFDDGTSNDITATQPPKAKAKDQRQEDTKYGVCEGRKISRILGLNTTSSELRIWLSIITSL
ncbi:chromo' (CHRromatin Organization MOdifier) domain protein [Ancylostoma ceylanicum]|uniref:Chromo' (CHRromatin Organization MOdifier) domain protein n=1 Tax=Ancylostoma ceylanicum TaxID=53326 RepID=A0A0D6L6C9_9BILA|nr:chromo' (CHRromatin Organization MOdifier) domain protein [Ancylostoma ceylanicum]